MQKSFLVFSFSLLFFSQSFCQKNEETLFIQEKTFEQKVLVLTPAAPHTSYDQTVVSIVPLYFKSSSKGTDYVLANKDFSLFLPQTSYIKSPSSHWDWGLRVGLSRIFGKEKLNGSFEFTYFRNAYSKKSSITGYGSLIPLKGPQAQLINFVKTSVHTTYYNLDASLAKDFFVSPKIAIKSLAGAKSSWITFSQKTLNQQNLSSPTHNFFIDERSKMWGIGPLSSMTMKWFCTEDVYFFGKTALAALFSYLQADQRSFTPHQEDKNFSLFHKDHCFIPYLELNLGLNWHKLFTSKKLLQIGLAYETQTYFGARELFYLDDFQDALRAKTEQKGISFYGVSFNASLFF